MPRHETFLTVKNGNEMVTLFEDLRRELRPRGTPNMDDKSSGSCSSIVRAGSTYEENDIRSLETMAMKNSFWMSCWMTPAKIRRRSPTSSSQDRTVLKRRTRLSQGDLSTAEGVRQAYRSARSSNTESPN